jgi:hypothetical protein
LNQIVSKVIDKELLTLVDTTKTVEQLNESFLKENSKSYESVIEAAKLIYTLNPESNQKKALELLNNISNYSLTLNVGLFQLEFYHIKMKF